MLGFVFQIMMSVYTLVTFGNNCLGHTCGSGIDESFSITDLKTPEAASRKSSPRITNKATAIETRQRFLTYINQKSHLTLPQFR